MGIYAAKPKFQKLLNPVTQFFIRHNFHPTYINILGLIASLLAGIVFYISAANLSLLWFIPILAFVRTALNALDGQVARGMKLKNLGFGEVLNETMDRISDAAFFIGLALSGLANPTLVWFTLTLVLINSYLSIVSKSGGGTRQYGGFMGKADRMTVFGALAVVTVITSNTQLPDYFVWLMLLGIFQTIVVRFLSIKSELYHGDN